MLDGEPITRTGDDRKFMENFWHPRGLASVQPDKKELSIVHRRTVSQGSRLGFQPKGEERQAHDALSGTQRIPFSAAFANRLANPPG